MHNSDLRRPEREKSSHKHIHTHMEASEAHISAKVENLTITTFYIRLTVVRQRRQFFKKILLFFCRPSHSFLFVFVKLKYFQVVIIQQFIFWYRILEILRETHSAQTVIWED